MANPSQQVMVSLLQAPPDPPEFVAYSTGNSASGGTLTIAKPTGTINGDLMIAFMGDGGGAGTWTMPAGWTEVYDQGASPDFGIAYKVASGEGASYDFVITQNAVKGGSIVTYRDGRFDKMGATVHNTSTLVAPSISVTEDSSILLAAYLKTGVSGSFSVPAGMTLRASGTGGLAPCWGVFSEEVSSGATGSRSSGTGGAASTGGLLAIKLA
jgi:hypothetical protein